LAGVGLKQNWGNRTWECNKREIGGNSFPAIKILTEFAKAHLQNPKISM